MEILAEGLDSDPSDGQAGDFFIDQSIQSSSMPLQTSTMEELVSRHTQFIPVARTGQDPVLTAVFVVSITGPTQVGCILIHQSVAIVVEPVANFRDRFTHFIDAFHVNAARCK